MSAQELPGPRASLGPGQTVPADGGGVSSAGTNHPYRDDQPFGPYCADCGLPRENARHGRYLEFVVYGKPITQGSKTKGRWGMYDDNAATLKPWRDNVRATAYDAMAGQTRMVDCPIRVRIVFSFDKPASAPKKRRWWPITVRSTGDIDKLQRSCFDSMTQAGVWKDDAQVVSVTADKVVVGQDEDALPIPGALIQVWQVQP